MDALDSVPVDFAATGDQFGEDGPSQMKLGVKEKEMKAQISNTLHGNAAQYRFTEPAALELNLFAGKKR